MAPDPGLFRLRVSLRAVLGIGFAVALSELAGLSLSASITGGLAALLALFTVGDTTVRGQALTTALLPVAASRSSRSRPPCTGCRRCATRPGSR